MKKNTGIIIAVVAIVALAAGFFGGQWYSRSQLRRNFAGRSGGFNFVGANGQTGGQNRFAGGGRVVGQILSIGNGTMTVKMPDGSSRIVILSDSTVYSKSAKASASDLKQGENVGVFGASNSDGSVTAQDIQINPEFRATGSGIQR